MQVNQQNNASVAQLDRVLGYEPSGQRFESSRMRHFTFLIFLYKTFLIIALHIAENPVKQITFIFCRGFYDAAIKTLFFFNRTLPSSFKLPNRRAA